MSKSNQNNTSGRGRRGGHMTKTKDETASVAPEGTETQTAEVVTESGATVELSAEDAAEVEQQGESAEVPAEAPAPDTEPAGEPNTDESTAESTPEAAAAPKDPFANLPMVKIEEYDFRDLSAADKNSDPRKYETVHKDAVSNKLPMKRNWKHSSHMIAMGQVRKEHKPNSVYGTIAQIVSEYGRAGVPAYVLVARVRQAQIGNKRSHYCTALPPIGWAEGWIDTFISKGHGRVMEKKAPPVTAEVKAEIAEGDKQATEEAARQAA